MRKRGIIGTLLLLVYLAGVGLFTGPSLAQIFLGRLPQPRLELAAGGVTSADDLLLNTLGGALGFAAARLLMRACPKLAPQGEGRAEWAAPLVCWLVIIAASTISDLLILW